MSKQPEITADRVPEHHRANRPAWVQRFGQWLYRRSGWRVVGSVPEDRLVVAAAAPHTSNWDFVIALVAMLALDLKANILMKQGAFIPLLGSFYRRMGVIAVNRSSPEGFVELIADKLKRQGTALLVVTPEGTRSKVEKWKTGFIRIARASNAKLIAVAPDFEKKTVFVGEVFEASGEIADQLERVKAYAGQVTPRYPEKF